ncbi:MAG TPA: 4Fe-4S binding protein [Thermodesulfovibrionales bacterium]|nr:4Fe-4S binding protein [Thermodesulfovibrionales bacterium]
MSIIIKNMDGQRTYIKKIRYTVQLAFLAFTLFIGYRFYQFVLFFKGLHHPLVDRPSSVDAFLPISGLMSLKYFLFTGTVEPIHPAAFVMFVTIVITSLLLKKGFCGWICPVGTIAQYFWMAGKKIFGKNFRMSDHADLAVRSLKYILMGLFLLLIGVIMTPNMMVLFFMSDYYITADIMTMNVFAQMSSLTMWVLIVLAALSLLYKNFWCRYLCPYGAHLGLLSGLGPMRISRTEEECLRCGSCTKSCPSLLNVEKKDVVSSPECCACMTCISSCPSPEALNITFKTGRTSRTFKPYLYPVFLILLFYILIGLGMVAGKWHSQISYEEYKRIIPSISQR